MYTPATVWNWTIRRSELRKRHRHAEPGNRPRLCCFRILGLRCQVLGPRPNAQDLLPYLSLTTVVPKDFGGESFDDSAFLPCIRGQPGFAAGLLEKGYAVPTALDRNLRQQQAAAAMPGDEQAVAADFNLLGGNRCCGRKNA